MSENKKVDLFAIEKEGPMSSFQQTACWSDIINLSTEISNIVKITFSITDTPEGCQDGTKLGSIGVYCRFPDNNRGLVGFSIFEVEFSRFHRFFTMRSPSLNWHIFSKIETDSIREILNNHGFIFLEEGSLSQKYDGIHPAFASGTWRDRFFSTAY